MKKTIYRSFDYTACDDFELFLNEMSAQGWHFKEWGLGLVFEKGEPANIQYAVEVFIHGKEKDMRPEPRAEEFAEYCEAAGWELVDAKRKFCIFKRLRDDATSIVTPEERLQNIKEAEMAVRGGRLSSGVIFALYIFRFFVEDFVPAIFSGALLALLLVMALSFMYAVYECVSLKVWEQKQRKKLRLGEKVHFGNGKRNRSKIYMIMLAFVLLALLWQERQNLVVYAIIIGLLVVVLFEILTRQLRPKRDLYKRLEAGICIVVFGFMIISAAYVLSTEDDSVVGKEEVSSVFGSATYYAVEYEYSNSVRYTVYESEYDWIMDRVWQEINEFGDLAEDRTEEWGAQSALVVDNWQYLLRYQDKIVELYHADELNSEQISIIREKLDLR